MKINKANTVEEIKEVGELITLIKKGEYTPTLYDLLAIFIVILSTLNILQSSKIFSVIKNKNILSYLNKDSVKESLLIEQILEDILLSTYASRVCVGIFHNGTNIGNFSFKNMSVLYEAKTRKTKSVKDLYRNVDLNKLKTHLIRLESEHFIKYSIKDKELLSECIDYLDVADIHTVYSRLLKNNIGEYGVIEIQYLTDNTDNVEIIKKKKDDIEKTYNKLVKLLNYIIRGERIPKYFYDDKPT